MLGLFSNKGKKIKRLLEQGAIVIDVRSKSEFESGHLKSSKNIPLDSLPAQMEQLDMTKPIIACCASGIRSGSAKRMLKAKGFTAINGGGWQSLVKYDL